MLFNVDMLTFSQFDRVLHFDLVDDVIVPDQVVDTRSTILILLTQYSFVGARATAAPRIHLR